jgi:hypothetical protein
MTVSLINATSEALHLELANGSLLPIPQIPTPQVVGHADRARELVVTIPGIEAGTVSLLEFMDEQVEGVLNLPPEIKNFLYIVPEEILTRVRHRHDFVAATAVRVVTGEHGDVERQILVGVTRIGLSELTADAAHAITAEADN